MGQDQSAASRDHREPEVAHDRHLTHDARPAPGRITLPGPNPARTRQLRAPPQRLCPHRGDPQSTGTQGPWRGCGALCTGLEVVSTLFGGRIRGRDGTMSR